MKNLTILDILFIVLAVFLLICVFPMPYGFYVFVRLITAAFMGYMTYRFYQSGEKGLMIATCLVMLLFQPIVKINFEHEIWVVIDILIAIIFLVYVIHNHHKRPVNVSMVKEHPSLRGSLLKTTKTIDSKCYDVFISYSTLDYLDSTGTIKPNNIISKIQTELSGNGISYWIDKKGLSGGAVFPKEIAKQIKNAKVFLYISSANSNDSMWTMNEIATANTYGKVIIPFRVDRTPYCPEIMIYVAGLHYIDYATNPSTAMTQLITSIQQKL